MQIVSGLLLGVNNPMAVFGGPASPAPGATPTGSKRPSPSPDHLIMSAEAKKMRFQSSMRILKDEPVPDGYVRFRCVLFFTFVNPNRSSGRSPVANPTRFQFRLNPSILVQLLLPTHLNNNSTHPFESTCLNLSIRTFFNSSVLTHPFAFSPIVPAIAPVESLQSTRFTFNPNSIYFHSIPIQCIHFNPLV